MKHDFQPFQQLTENALSDIIAVGIVADE